MTVLMYEKDHINTSIEELVLLARQGDHDAFSQLVERFEGRVFSIAMRRLGNEDEARELSQEVFLKVFTKLDQLRVPAAFAGWISAIVDRMAINVAVRRKPVYSVETVTLEANCIDEETPLSVVLASERQAQVRDGLQRLRRLDRETLEAFYVRGRSLIQMSGEFDSPIGTIKRRLHVARKRLKKELEHDVVN